ncbi:25S rRNA (adenine2142-N1)-methyltransferase [Didymosphaeria variabile]|uniref:25S rRNA adenine-N(1) methyltransferase n=1 Tax=Didymosphaeria variabile TaxID=1932322 RepID=A0A9W9CBG9_9PLEO|nr:25S rRNA (adenine2142-N1)-methyltransferase [Didymosphaeria variabile]KAJ4353992.1 25S rRNA (adenine2142-N1)-methyltransferase [Didymosphaeria variabile]
MAVKRRQKTLSQGRPPTSKPKERMTSQRSRTIIRTHHRLHKEHASAVKKGDTKLAASIAKAIEENGGLEVYQAASKQGQSKDRGGDSSKVLVDWLLGAHILDRTKKAVNEDAAESILRCLEVGALSTNNEISKYPKKIEMTRIDLNSQGTGIERQDFMKRPLPASASDRFDIVSLSLVLNYVPDPAQRGEMLKRVTQFLRRTDLHQNINALVLPALFLVLPLPCVENSRYLDERVLLRIMTNLGFSLMNEKKTPKLCYYLFSLTGASNSTKTEKKKVRDGPAMNNFCVIVD